MRWLNRLSRGLLLLGIGTVFVSLIAVGIPASAQTTAPTASPTTPIVPTFKQIGQIGKGAVESIGWIVGSNHVEIRVGSQMQYFDSHLAHLGTLDLQGKAITAVDHDDTYTVLGFDDGTVQLYTIIDRKLYATLTGHIARINSVIFSADKSKLISASNDGTVRVWDVANHTLLQTLGNSSVPVTIAGFASDKSDDPTRAYSYNAANKTWNVWNTNTGTLVTSLVVPDSTWPVSLMDPTVHYLVTNVPNSTGHILILTDVTTNTQKTIVTNFSQPPTNALFSIDGRELFVASVFSGQATILDTATLNVIQTITLAPDKLRTAQFSNDGTQLAIGTADGALLLENVSTGQESHFTPSVTPIRAVRFNHTDDRLFIVDTTGQITVLDTAGHLIGKMDNGVDVIDFSYDTKSPVIVTTNSAGDVITWDATSLQKLGTVSGFSNLVYPLIWSPDGKQLAGAGTDHAIHIWDATTDKELRQLKGHTLGVTAIAWSPDGKLIASASSDMTVRIWDATTGQELHKITFTDRNYAVAFSPDSKYLAVGSRQFSKQLTLFGADGIKLSTLTNLIQTVDNIAWRPNDPTHLLAAEAGGTLAVVDVTDVNKPQATQTRNSSVPITAFAWSPDGSQVLVSSADHVLRFWSFTNTLTLQHSINMVSITYDVSWNKSGNLIALTDGDLIRLIDPTGTSVGTISGHTALVVSAEWSPDGTRFASSSNDGTIRIWQQ